MTAGQPRRHQSLLAIIQGAILWGLLLVLAGCAEESPVISHSDPAASRYRQESEPARSPDGQYVYHISTDTLDPSRSGLWRAKITEPRREKLLSGVSFSSPSASPTNDVIAFLDSSQVAYFRTSDSQRVTSSMTRSYTALVMLNDDELIGQRGDSLFLLSEPDSSEHYVVRGSDPTLVAIDTFVYVAPVSGITYGIVKSGLPGLGSDTIYVVSPQTSPISVHWPVLDNASGNLVWMQEYTTMDSVFALQMPSSDLIAVDRSHTQKPCLIDQFHVIFTGPDGRFYKADFHGSASGPFWHVEGGE